MLEQDGPAVEVDDDVLVQLLLHPGFEIEVCHELGQPVTGFGVNFHQLGVPLAFDVVLVDSVSRSSRLTA